MGNFDLRGLVIMIAIICLIGGAVGWELVSWLADLIWDEGLREWLHALTAPGEER